MKKRVKKSTFAEWISLQSAPDFTRSRILGSFVGFLIVLVAIAVALGGLATIFQFLSAVLKTDANDEAVRNFGLILAAVLGAPFILWRAIVAQKQANIAEQGHITDQINKGVAGLGAEKIANRIGRPVKIFTGEWKEITHLQDNIEKFSLEPRSIELRRYLRESNFHESWQIDVITWEKERTIIQWQGSDLFVDEEEYIDKFGDWSVFSESLPNIEVRVGAIYALERISQDSERDHIQIMEILTAYIRENAPVKDLYPSEEPFKFSVPRTDIQAALDVIGRRDPALVDLEHSKKYRLDLREVDLSGANFARGNFDGVLFFRSRLEASNFCSANLRGARLNGSLLNFCDFSEANMRGAIIDKATINRSNHWNGSIPFAADISGLSMAAADISVVNSLPNNLKKGPTFATADTKLGAILNVRRNELSTDMGKFFNASQGIEIENINLVKKRLQEAGFLFWSPFKADDGASGSLLLKLWDELGLHGFPYRD